MMVIEIGRQDDSVLLIKSFVVDRCIEVKWQWCVCPWKVNLIAIVG